MELYTANSVGIVDDGMASALGYFSRVTGRRITRVVDGVRHLSRSPAGMHASMRACDAHSCQRTGVRWTG